MNDMIKDKKKIEIMNIATELFYKKSIVDTTISEITYTANIGKGTFYEYFKNKDDVVCEYIKKYFENTLFEIDEKIENYKMNSEKLINC